MTRLLLAQGRQRGHHRPKGKVMEKGAATEPPHPQRRKELVLLHLERHEQECPTCTPKESVRMETNVIAIMSQNVETSSLAHPKKVKIAFGTTPARRLLPSSQKSLQLGRQRKNPKRTEQLLLRQKPKRMATWHWPCAPSLPSAARQEQKH